MGTTTADAQRILVGAGAEIAVDGVWGPKSTKAYNAAPIATQVKVQRVFQDKGKSFPWVKTGIPIAEAQALVARAAGEVGMSEHIIALQQFLDYEAPKIGPNKDQYMVNAQNGSSRGLMQMQPAAWSDAKRSYPALPGYDKVFDPYSNILAGVVYARINAQIIKKYGFRVTGKNLYLAHNQGAGFFKGVRTAVDKQSKIVQQLIASGPDR